LDDQLQDSVLDLPELVVAAVEGVLEDKTLPLDFALADVEDLPAKGVDD
jgi:hypothetical protein